MCSMACMDLTLTTICHFTFCQPSVIPGFQYTLFIIVTVHQKKNKEPSFVPASLLSLAFCHYPKAINLTESEFPCLANGYNFNCHDYFDVLL